MCDAPLRVVFESSWKKPYSDRGVRKLLARYAQQADLARPISSHRLRHFLLPRHGRGRHRDVDAAEQPVA